ncbi:hypothetical protein ACSBPH_01545 [Microbacterium sp. F51-2R]|uniref:hypothetical protein n=1 Tax=Microbacterium sp. F51-2R TaxID=3445777 RepID=UPI003F9EBFA0
MRFGSSDLKGVLTGPFDAVWTADLYYNGERRIADVPIADVRFGEDANADVQQSGSCTVVWTDEFASSVLPVSVSDPLAPFGAQLYVYCLVSAGNFSERVAYGRFLITDVPSARDEEMRFRGEWVTVGSTVGLELRELLAGVQQESFDVPTAPTDLSSTWAELGRVSGLPLIRSVADVPITRSVMYPDGKLDAVYELMGVMLDAVPHVTSDGALSARPNVWPDPVDDVTLDVIESVSSSMSAAQVYNRVVVRATGGDQAAVLAVAEVTSGPLRVRNPDGSVSPFRARTRYLSSEFVTTVEQAQAWADSELAKVSVLRSRVVEVVETFNPLRERGDAVRVERNRVWLIGRVVSVDRGGATQRLRVEVASTVPKADAVDVFPGFTGFGLFPDGELFPADDEFPEA